MDNEHLLAAVAADPDADAPRLVYADWLEEAGERDAAEFIRVQLAVARNADARGDLPPADYARLHARERELLAHYGDDRLAALHRIGARGRTHAEFYRGFVDEPVIDARNFLDHGEELFRLSPVATLFLDRVGRLARRVARSPLLGRVRRLTLEGVQSVTAKGAKTLLDSEHLGRLESLRFTGVPLRDDDVAALAAGPPLPGVREFSLGDAAVTGRTVPALLRRFPNLEAVRLTSLRRWDARHTPAVLAALDPARVREFAFDWTPIGADGFAALAAARDFTNVEELWLRWCGLSWDAAGAFADAGHWTRVRTLYLGGDGLGDDGAAALSRWPGLRAVQTLNLDHCGVGPAGVAALAGALSGGAVESLDLRASPIGDDGAAALAAADLPALRFLDLDGVGLSAAGVEHLAGAPWAGKLRRLDLPNNFFGDAGAAAIGRSPAAASLRWLTLDRCAVSEGASRRLLDQLPNLVIYHTDSGFHWGEGVEAMRAANRRRDAGGSAG